MSMFYGNKFLDPEMLDQQVEIEMYIETAAKITLLEDGASANIVVKNKGDSVKIYISNTEAAARGIGELSINHGSRVKIKSKTYKGGVSIIFHYKNNEQIIEPDISDKRSKDEFTRSKEWKLTKKFIETNFDDLVNIWKEKDPKVVYDTITNMDNKGGFKVTEVNK